MDNRSLSVQKNYKKMVTLFAGLLMLPTLTQAVQQSHVRNGRYCEVILSQSLTQYGVYNTWGLNNCPAKSWNKVTVDQVKKDTGSSSVHLNGPRYWVIDGFENTQLINPTIKTLGGLQMREAGVINFSLFDLLKTNSPYHKRKVDRQTTWIYQPGKPVYELIDPKGTVFVMQSYSVQNYSQTEKSLDQLATKLTLPVGWQYKVGLLKKLETLQAINNQAVVVQDNFLNTYQMATHDFLHS